MFRNVVAVYLFQTLLRTGMGKEQIKHQTRRLWGNTVAESSHVHSSDDSFGGLDAAGLLSVADEVPFCTKDQDANGSLGGLSEQDLCIKCGKDGQLLKCSNCMLAAHDICFGSSVTFEVEESSQFYCPVCLYNKATDAKGTIVFSCGHK